MKYYLNLEEETRAHSINWCHSIGILDCDDDTFLEIDFIKTPAILKTVSHLQSCTPISHISGNGVTFYLADAMLHTRDFKHQNLEFESGSTDGVCFVPMSNIQSLNSAGNIMRCE
jgi:hypothetical protein